MNSSWILRSKPKPKAHLRFFCFPYAGAGASAFASWADLMPPEVELCAVQLPGRESRLREKPFVRLPPLVRAVRESLRPYLHKPFAFFGHSMGALISFELARELRRTLWRWFRRRAWKPSGASFPRPLPRGVAVCNDRSPSAHRPVDQFQVRRRGRAGRKSRRAARATGAGRRLRRTAQRNRADHRRYLARVARHRADRRSRQLFRAGRPVATGKQVVARVRTALKTDLPLRRFFEEPTVAELAHAILLEKNGQSSAKPQESAAIASV